MLAVIAVAIFSSLVITTLPRQSQPATAPVREPSVQEPSQPATGREVTEEELVASIAPEHPAVAALEEPIGVAEAGVLDASTFDAPELSIAREDPSGEGALGVEQLDVTVSWELPGRSRRATIEAARLRAGAARTAAGVERLALRRELRAVFAEWAVATERMRILAQHAQRLRRLADRERGRAERGEVSGLAARRLELAAAEARSRLAFSRAEAEAARQVVAGWNAELAGGRPVLPASRSLEVTNTPNAERTHPRLLAIEQELEAARLERQAARRLEALPELLAGWQRQEDGLTSLDGPLIGISWRMPIFDPNRGERAAAAARIAGSEARLAQARRTIRAEREATIASLGILTEALAAARESSAAIAPLVDGTIRAFELGELEVFELLDVLRSVADAQLRVLELREALLAADRRLEFLTAAWP